MNLELTYAAIYAGLIVVSVWYGFRLKGFLKATPCISDEQSLDRFKAVARLNKYLGLLLVVFFAGGAVIGIMLVLRHGLLGLAGVLLANAVAFALAKCLGKFEKLARSLPASSEDLAQRHRQISEAWVKKLFPDF